MTLPEIVEEIIDVLDVQIKSRDDNLMQEAMREAKAVIEPSIWRLEDSSAETQQLLKFHGLTDLQLKLKLSLYNEVKNSIFSEKWFDFINSLLGSIPDQVVPGIGAIKEIKDMLHIKYYKK